MNHPDDDNFFKPTHLEHLLKDHQEDMLYLASSSGMEIFDKDGNIVDNESAESHIPLGEFIFRP